MENGEWRMENGEWRMENGPTRHCEERSNPFLIKNNVLDCFVPRNDGEHRDHRDMSECLVLTRMDYLSKLWPTKIEKKRYCVKT